MKEKRKQKSKNPSPPTNQQANKPTYQFVFWVRKFFLVAAICASIFIFFVEMGAGTAAFFWGINSWVLFFVMMIRPTANLFPQAKWLGTWIAARKEMGIFSAAIVLSFGVSKYAEWGMVQFLGTYFSLEFWRFPEPVFWGRIGELAAVPLLLTSNLWSQKKLKKNWKRIQRLSYLYFFAGSYYVWAAFGSERDLVFMILVVIFTALAAAKNRRIWPKKFQKI